MPPSATAHAAGTARSESRSWRLRLRDRPVDGAQVVSDAVPKQPVHVGTRSHPAKCRGSAAPARRSAPGPGGLPSSSARASGFLSLPFQLRRYKLQGDQPTGEKADMRPFRNHLLSLLSLLALALLGSATTAQSAGGPTGGVQPPQPPTSYTLPRGRSGSRTLRH
jgi:hypothetical protein